MAGLMAGTDYQNLRRQEIRHPKLTGVGHMRRISYNDVHKLVARAAKDITVFRPEAIVGIGGGGLIPARILRTYVPTAQLLAVTLHMYDDVTLDVRPEPRVIQWIEASVAEEFITGKRVLVVDDIDDTRTTLGTVVPKLKEFAPLAIGVFVLHSKRKDKRAFPDVSDWIIGDTIDDVWVEYPWDATDIDKHASTR